jgi:hypothetical protein
LEALQNAKYNLCAPGAIARFQQQIGQDQLSNAVTLLEKGYALDAEVEPLIEKYGDVDLVPEAEAH